MFTPRSVARLARAWWFFGVAWMASIAAAAAVAPASAENAEDEREDVTKMAAYNVAADRIEDFGFRVSLRGPPWSSVPFVSAVCPNTAAAKAGLRPGDRILTSDGRSATGSLFSFNKWRQMQTGKWKEVSSGKKTVSWTLEVEVREPKGRRTVTMVVPTPPPHWGAKTWRRPEGRVPAVVSEPGPLAALARDTLDHGIWAVVYWRALAGPPGQSKAHDEPALGFQWTLETPDKRSHRIIVSQQAGRTEVLLHRYAADGRHMFTTSPAGALEMARFQKRGERSRDLPLEEARAEFEKEIAFWLDDVGRVTGRWPFELRNATAGNAVEAAPPPARAAPAAAPRAESFLKLPPATAEQRALFADALGKLGADEDNWAYTETSRGLDDKRVTVVRVDPSKPAAERCTLLKIDGKAPSAAEVKRWREEGRDSTAALGELPPLAQLVDLSDVRVLAEERTATVFECALRGGGAFPADKFQALFRVNKAHRGFEDFGVKLRESFGIASGVKVTEAGLEARFQTLDPAHPPQPVKLKAGGAVRVLLLVKLARAFEATRMDFRRVEPFRELVPE